VVGGLVSAIVPQRGHTWFSQRRRNSANLAGSWPYQRRSKPVWASWQLRAFDLATGKTSLLRNVRGPLGTGSAAAPGPTGRYLLLLVVPGAKQGGATWMLYRLDVATGQMTQLKSTWAIEPGIAR
jgi:hypothetical protein